MRITLVNLEMHNCEKMGESGAEFGRQGKLKDKLGRQKQRREQLS